MTQGEVIDLIKSEIGRAVEWDRMNKAAYLDLCEDIVRNIHNILKRKRLYDENHP